MSDAALVPIYPHRSSARGPRLVSHRLQRGLRRTGLGLKLLALGVGDLLIGVLETAAAAIGVLILAAARLLTAAARAVDAFGVTLVRVVRALLQSPARVIHAWARWAWQITRPLFEGLAWMAMQVGRFLLTAAMGLGVLLLIVALSPLLAVAFDGLRALVLAGGDAWAWLASRVPRSTDVAQLPWGGAGARLGLAALILLVAAVAVAVLAFGLWLLALSAYVAARSVAVAAPPVVRGARRAGVEATHALGLLLFLMLKIAGQSALVLLPLLALAALVGLAVAFGPRLTLPLGDAVSRAADLGGGWNVGWLIVALAALAGLLALIMLARVFARSSRAHGLVLGALLAFAVTAPLVWLASPPAMRSSIAAFAEACGDFLARAPRVAVAEAAVPEAASDELVSPASGADARLEGASEPETASTLGDASSTSEPPTAPPPPDVIYPSAPASWRFGSDALVTESASDNDAAHAVLPGALDPAKVCDARVLVAVGAASSDGRRAYNEALAYRRGLRLARAAETAAADCEGAARPEVWVLNLGQSLVAPPAPEQRAPLILTPRAAPDVPLDLAGALAADLPVDAAAYSAHSLCVMNKGREARNTAQLPTCVRGDE